MAYSITLAHSRGILNDAQRDQWFKLVTSVGLSVDHPAFDEELIAVATEAIKKTRDGKQRFAIPYGEFGKCIFLNDVEISELQSVLRTHKQFVKERFGSGEGKEAYVDAGDLGANPDEYASKAPVPETQKVAEKIKANGVDSVKGVNGVNGANGHSHTNGNGVKAVECSC